MLADIRRAAHELFAEHGYDAVTTDDIAGAAGVSTSTLFRHVATKESLLVAPLLENVSGVVAAYQAQPPDKSAGKALISAVVEAMNHPNIDDTRVWLAAIRSAPHLINRVALVSDADRERLVLLTAERSGDTDPARLRSALLVHVLLEASEYLFQKWVSGAVPAEPPLAEQIETALTIVLTADWDQ